MACRSARWEKPQSQYVSDIHLVYLALGFWTENVIFSLKVEYCPPVVVVLQCSWAPKYYLYCNLRVCCVISTQYISELAGESLLKAPWGLSQSSPIPHRTINRLWGRIRENVHSRRPADESCSKSDINMVRNISALQSMLDLVSRKHTFNILYVYVS